MTGEVTSPQGPGAWRQFGTFVKRPSLPDRVTGIEPRAFPVLARLFALDLLLMALLIGLAGLATALGMDMPEHLLDELELSSALILFILVGAPIGEELLFRSWLSGRPGHVGAFFVVLGTIIAAGVAAGIGSLQLVLVVALAGLALAVLVLWRKRGRGPMPFFARHFRWFYLGSTLAFASVHLANFTEGNALVLLPLTLPQFLLGLILGYVRVQFGLWANVLFHAVHNALFVGLIMLGSGAA